MLFTVKKWQTKNKTILISKSHKKGDNRVTMPQTAQNGPHRLGSRKKIAKLLWWRRLGAALRCTEGSANDESGACKTGREQY